MGDDTNEPTKDDQTNMRATRDNMDMDDIARIYRRWVRGEIIDEEARELVGDEFSEFRRMARNDEIVERTPDLSADDDELFFDDD